MQGVNAGVSAVPYPLPVQSLPPNPVKSDKPAIEKMCCGVMAIDGGLELMHNYLSLVLDDTLCDEGDVRFWLNDRGIDPNLDMMWSLDLCKGEVEASLKIINTVNDALGPILDAFMPGVDRNQKIELASCEIHYETEPCLSKDYQIFARAGVVYYQAINEVGVESGEEIVLLSFEWLVSSCSKELYGLDLSDLDLSLFKLDGANLAGAILRGAKLIGTSMLSADLSGADMSGANLITANLKDAILVDASVWCADFRGANLMNANFRKALVWQTFFDGANLTNANFEYAYLVKVEFGCAKLKGVKFKQTIGLSIT